MLRLVVIFGQLVGKKRQYYSFQCRTRNAQTLLIAKTPSWIIILSGRRIIHDVQKELFNARERTILLHFVELTVNGRTKIQSSRLGLAIEFCVGKYKVDAAAVLEPCPLLELGEYINECLVAKFPTGTVYSRDFFFIAVVDTLDAVPGEKKSI